MSVISKEHFGVGIFIGSKVFRIATMLVVRGDVGENSLKSRLALKSPLAVSMPRVPSTPEDFNSVHARSHAQRTNMFRLGESVTRAGETYEQNGERDPDWRHGV